MSLLDDSDGLVGGLFCRSLAENLGAAVEGILKFPSSLPVLPMADAVPTNAVPAVPAAPGDPATSAATLDDKKGGNPIVDVELQGDPNADCAEDDFRHLNDIVSQGLLSLGRVMAEHHVLILELSLQIGMGRFQWVMFYVCGVGWAADNMWLQGLALALSSVANEFNVSSALSASGTSCTFAGMIIGAFVWGIIADVVGRRPSFLMTVTLGAIFGGAAAFSANFAMYCAMLFLMGCGVGGNLPVDGSFFLEFIPRERQSLLTLLSLFWPVGQVVAALFAWWLMPTYSCTDTADCHFSNNKGWRYLLFTLALATLAMLIARLTLVKMFESPKYLIANGRKEEAVKVLKELAKMNGKEDLIVIRPELLPDVKVVEGRWREEAVAHLKEMAYTKVRPLFGKDVIRTTLLVWGVWMSIAIAYTMFYSFLPTFIKNAGGASLTVNETYRNYLIQSLAGVPGSVAGYFLVDSRLGRRVIYAYTPEAFHTKHRGIAVGTASALGRIVGVSAPFLSGWLVGINANIALYLSAALFVLTGAFAFFLPIETRGVAAM
ncbi:hypothetical protein HK101_002599 [Irineochytrium annulatum]|nr:hypothetical protein HK101_002599 [Irineochytrium annulatum]